MGDFQSYLSGNLWESDMSHAEKLLQDKEMEMQENFESNLQIVYRIEFNVID